MSHNDTYQTKCIKMVLDDIIERQRKWGGANVYTPELLEEHLRLFFCHFLDLHQDILDFLKERGEYSRIVSNEKDPIKVSSLRFTGRPVFTINDKKENLPEGVSEEAIRNLCSKKFLSEMVREIQEGSLGSTEWGRDLAEMLPYHARKGSICLQYAPGIEIKIYSLKNFHLSVGEKKVLLAETLSGQQYLKVYDKFNRKRWSHDALREKLATVEDGFLKEMLEKVLPHFPTDGECDTTISYEYRREN